MVDFCSCSWKCRVRRAPQKVLTQRLDDAGEDQLCSGGHGREAGTLLGASLCEFLVSAVGFVILHFRRSEVPTVLRCFWRLQDAIYCLSRGRLDFLAHRLFLGLQSQHLTIFIPSSPISLTASSILTSSSCLTLRRTPMIALGPPRYPRRVFPSQ